ncbi:MAG: PD-(D/E)XK nuclease family protein [Candidatus Woesearchaeota archaeon]
MVIKQVYFNHKGGLYVYRVHNEKVGKLCSGDFGPLKDYLHSMLNKCPNEYFNGGPRGSCLRFNLVENAVEVAGHEVSTLTRYGLDVNKDRFKDRHSKVQAFMLENDQSTLAMEIPIWLMPNELVGYKTLFKCDDVLTGHIDILRVEGDKIWVWDYKPNANKEKYATTQTFFYAYMLSKRTGISLDNFRCGYFDHNFAYVYRPERELLLKLNRQQSLVESV